MILNIILISLLIHSVFYYRRGGTKGILACGLFAYCGEKDNNNFNWDKFNILGWDNDDRGGDSIGRLIGNSYSAHVAKTPKTSYKKYVENYINEDSSNIALGHTRKASVGAATIANAQPVVFNLSEDEGESYFGLIHNGTLYNHIALAKKYNVPHEGRTDSQILASIIMNNGFEVLKEYEGAAALVIKDPRIPNTLYAFKGASKSWGGIVEEERPLYYYQESENSMYISSKEDGLMFIGGNIDSIFEFESNVLYTIKEGKIINTETIDRSSKYQTNPTYRSTSNYGYGYNNGYYNNGRNNNYKPAHKNKGPLLNKAVQLEEVPKGMTKNHIVFAKLRYYKNKQLVQGKLIVNKHGVIKHKITNEDEDFVFYFYRGMMMRNKEAFDKVTKIVDNLAYYDERTDLLKIIEYSLYPATTLGNSNTGVTRSNTSTHGFFTGEVAPYFSNKQYVFNHGDLTAIRNLTEVKKPKKEETRIISLPNTITQLADTLIPDGNSRCPQCKGVFAVSLTCKTCNKKGYIEDPEEEEYNTDPLMENEYNKVFELMITSVDSSRGDLERTGDSSAVTAKVTKNLSALEDALLETDNFKTKEIKIAYE